MQDFTQSSWLQKLFLTRPLTHIFTYANLIILILLIGTLSLGARQYIHYQRSSDTVAHSDSLNFQFNALQQYLASALLEGRQFDLERITKESRQLSRQSDKLLHNPFIPESLKPYLLSEQEMMQLLVQLQAIKDSGQWDSKQVAAVISRLHDMAADLQQFRLQVNEYSQNILSGIHKVIIGFLGLIVAINCALLFSLNQSIAAPLLSLASRVHRQTSDDRSTEEGDAALTMHRLLTETTQLLDNSISLSAASAPLTASRRQYLAIARGTIFLHAEHALTNLTNGILNYTQQLADLQQNPDKEMQYAILQSLQKEENRLASLVRCLRKCTGVNKGKLLPVAFEDFIENLRLTLAQSMAAEGITLQTSTANVSMHDLPPLNAVILLVCMTILETGRVCLQAAAAPEKKWICLKVQQSGQDAAFLTFSNGVHDWDARHLLDTTLWPDRKQCTEWLQQQGGTINFPLSPADEQLITVQFSRNPLYNPGEPGM
ncbi:MAG: hypothetical protein CSA33_01295 [Desulfobulbus propionicus]|nr:MAG: hypothetical protein CSA33_01295 [Desulfobulbus propionicus]